MSGNVNIVGNIAGQVEDFLNLLQKIGEPSVNNKILFLGDIICRGVNSLECIMIVYLLKLNYPQYVFILRGKME